MFLWCDICCNIVSDNIFVPYKTMYSILRYLLPLKYIFINNKIFFFVI